jgi:hypothetical protein
LCVFLYIRSKISSHQTEKYDEQPLGWYKCPHCDTTGYVGSNGAVFTEYPQDNLGLGWVL